MRYIADNNGYLKEVSFGANIVCGGAECTEYTGNVPSGYESLEAWFLAEFDSLCRWHVVGGNLEMDSSATPWVDKPPYVPYGYVAENLSVKTYNDFVAKIEEIYADMSNDSRHMVVVELSTGGDDVPSGTWFVDIVRFSETCGYVTLSNGDCTKITRCIDETWGAWEWVNPPMVLGQEYRTTERWNGKVVFVKAINCGALPHTTTKNVAHGITGATQFVSVRVFANYNGVAFEFTRSGGGDDDTVMVSGGNVVIKTNWSAASYAAQAHLKYVK